MREAILRMCLARVRPEGVDEPIATQLAAVLGDAGRRQAMLGLLDALQPLAVVRELRAELAANGR
jgi:hypothetical protein